MANNFYGAVALTGGGTGALDAIDGTDLADLDTARVVTLSYTYFYSLDVDSAAAESSPDVISPDANAGNKRWILTGINQVTATEFSQLETLGTTTISAAQWGYVGGMTKNPIGGDGTAGRVYRHIKLKIDNGTTAATLKCTVSSEWNGDAIAETNNIAKNATTGNFTLDSSGYNLKIEAAGLTGNAVYASGVICWNRGGTDLTCMITIIANDISMEFFNTAAGATVDLTTLVDTGRIDLMITYFTDA